MIKMIRTTFKITAGGLPIISAKAIEDAVTRMLEEYLSDGMETPHAIDVDAFLREYLHMNLEEKRLSHDGFILGMTVFQDTDKLICWSDERNQAEYCSVQGRTILVDRFKQSEVVLRFTKAHEGGHAYFHNAFMERHPGEVFCRESTDTISQKRQDKTSGEWTENQWKEWQANTFASCLLMPEPMMRILISGRPAIYAGDPLGERTERIYRVSEVFQVSRAAAAIRLKGMGLLEEENRYACVCLGTDKYTDLAYVDPYYDALGNYIPERPLDPPETEVTVTKRKRSRK